MSESQQDFDQALVEIEKEARPPKHKSKSWDIPTAQRMINEMTSNGRLTENEGRKIMEHIQASQKRVMDDLKKGILATHPFLFGAILVAIVFALVFDLLVIFGLIPNEYDMFSGSFTLGSLFVTAYFVGIAMTYRFLCRRKSLNKGAAVVITVFTVLSWIFIQSIITGGQYRPSLLLYLCILAYYKTLRFTNPPPELPGAVE